MSLATNLATIARAFLGTAAAGSRAIYCIAIGY